MRDPAVSIVTPCLNMARYLEAAVRSVLEQDYPAVDYLVVDGGSTDGSVDLLRRYTGRLRYLSEPDRGPADAINKGFRLARGEILAWLNADDYYLTRTAVSEAVRAFARHPEAAVVYADGVWVDEEGREIGPYPVADFDPRRLARECFLCQPAAFIRRRAFEEIGGLNPDLKYAFDYDLWIRLARRFPFVRVPGRWAASRMHRATITLGARRAVFRETLELLRRHYGYVPFRWVYSYVAFRLDRRDQFFEPLRPGFGKYLLSLPAGLCYNRRRPLRYVNEWRKVMTWSGLRRRLRALSLFR